MNFLFRILFISTKHANIIPSWKWDINITSPWIWKGVSWQMHPFLSKWRNVCDLLHSLPFQPKSLIACIIHTYWIISHEKTLNSQWRPHNFLFIWSIAPGHLKHLVNLSSSLMGIVTVVNHIVFFVTYFCNEVVFLSCDKKVFNHDLTIYSINNHSNCPRDSHN